MDHVDLTANVVQTAIVKGPSSAQTTAALAALDQNTHTARTAAAKKDLAGYISQFSAFVCTTRRPAARSEPARLWPGRRGLAPAGKGAGKPRQG